MPTRLREVVGVLCLLLADWDWEPEEVGEVEVLVLGLEALVRRLEGMV